MSEIFQIYINLLNEGAPVCRPVKAYRQNEDTYQIAEPEHEDEEWGFQEGEVVRVVERRFSGKESPVLVAVEKVEI